MSGQSRGLLFILSAPSGCGKTTVVGELLRRDPNLTRAVTHTTRRARPGERDGVDYHFLTPAEFLKKRDSGIFLEWASIYEYFYGTSSQEIEELLRQGKDVLLAVDIQGARTIRSKRKGIFIFLLPPSFEELERRLSQRGTEPEGEARRRIEQARVELKAANEYDYRVVNDTVEKAAREILTIIQENRRRVQN